MMMNWATRLLNRMIMGMQKGAASAMQEELKNIQDELLKGTFDPQKIAEFAKKMGIDLNAMPGMMGQQPGFDPYAVFHLDKSASDEEVKRAYRKVMSTIHPDKAGPELTFMATIANAAYKLIKKERGWQ